MFFFSNIFLAFSYLLSSAFFLFFCDFGEELANAVTEGRRREFAGFARFSDPAVREQIPDPNAVSTFTASVLDWQTLTQTPHQTVLALYRELLALRHQWITPRLAGMGNGEPRTTLLSETALDIVWQLAEGSHLRLSANLGETSVNTAPFAGTRLFATANLDSEALTTAHLPAWSTAWHLQTKD